MPVLYRYLLNLFLMGFLKIFMVFMGLFFLLDGADQIRRSAKLPNAYWPDILLLIVFRMPEYLLRFMPAIALLATLLVLSKLSRQSEITVMRSSGFSLHQLLTPFLLGGLIIGSVQLAILDQIVPRTNLFAQNMFDYLNNKSPEPNTIHRGAQDVWLRDKQQIVHAKRVSAQDQVLLDILVFNFNEHFQLVSRVDARKAVKAQEGWYLFDGTEYRFGAFIEVEPFDLRPWEAEIKIEQLNQRTPQPQFLSLNALWNYAERLSREGYTAAPFWTLFYRKLADPLTTLTAILLAFPFALTWSRSSNTIRPILIGLLAGFCLFVIIDLTTALGMGGRLPPLLSAWSPVAFFSGIAGFLFLRMEETHKT
ncbi:LPS export ABC transporter permease LptG [Magnetococcales bacterium HHB-1]